jgi:hypothetical protein
VKTLRKAEEALDGFWRHVDTCLVENGAISERLKRMLATKSMQGTPLWAPPAQGTDMTVHPPNMQSLSAYYHELQIKTEATQNGGNLVPGKEKGKTRGVARPPDLQENVAAERDASSPAHYSTKKAHDAVFKALSFTPKHASSVQMRWIDFVDAMTHVGFAIEKSYTDRFGSSLLRSQ